MMAALKTALPYVYSHMKGALAQSLGHAGITGAITSANVGEYLGGAVLGVFLMAVPFLLTASVAGVVFAGAQTRFLFSRQRLKFRFDRLSPVLGIRNLVTLRSLTEIAKAMAKAALIGVILYTEIRSRAASAMRLPYMDVYGGLLWIADAAYSIGIKICIIMAGLGVLDYFYQWWEYERSLRMTKQEIKDEHKNLEGDPHIKGRIRQIQRHMAMSRMMHKVKKADVVVRNPTHYAVALQYEKNGPKAPVVVAKGADNIALRIVETAEEHKVAVVENRPLARGLYEAVELGMEIPEQYYQAVAEVLAFVYGLKRGNQAG